MPTRFVENAASYNVRPHFLLRLKNKTNPESNPRSVVPDLLLRPANEIWSV